MKNRIIFSKRHKSIKKRGLLENNIISGFILLFFLIASTSYLFIFCSFFQIDSIVVDSDKKLTTSEDKIINSAYAVAVNNFLFFDTKSIFFTPTIKITKNIIDNNPVIESAVINKIFPSTIEIYTKEREPYAIWCMSQAQNNCYYIDKKGIVFKNTNGIDEEFLLFVKIKKNMQLGMKIIEEDKIENMLLVLNKTAKEAIEISYFLLPDTDNFIAVTTKGWKIYFSFDDIELELSDLINIALKEIDSDQINNLEYIDLRFTNKIYYK